MTFLSHKLKDEEITLLVESIMMHHRGQKLSYLLIISSSNIYILDHLAIKRQIKIQQIECVIVTPFSNEMLILYNSKEGKDTKESKKSLIIESVVNVRIVQHIITVKEKFMDTKKKLMVTVSQRKYLHEIGNTIENQNKTKVLGFIFKKK